MPHPRQEIRAAVRAMLATPSGQTFPTAARDRVYATRSAPLAMNALPAILIYTRDERLDPTSDYPVPGRRRRVMRLAIEAVASGDAADDAVDEIAWAIEQAFDRDNTIGNRIEMARLSQTEIDAGDEGDRTIVAARLTYDVAYWIIASDGTDEGDSTSPGPDGDLLVGWAPEIGPGHEDDYVPVDRLPVGDCGEA
jgi:hypothetical protein